MTATPPPYPFAWTSPVGPPPELRTARDRPVLPVTLPSGDRALLITRFDDVRRALGSPAVSHDLLRPGAPKMLDGYALQDPGIPPDPPDYTRVRGLAAGAFTAEKAEKLREFATRTADELLDAVAAGPRPADLNAAFARPLTFRLLARMLGVPALDHERFARHADSVLGSGGGRDEQQALQAKADLWLFADELVKRRRAEPADDLTTELIAARGPHEDELTDYEIVHWLLATVIGGYEAPVGIFGSGLVLLLHHRDQYTALTADPSLVPGAVEEVLRCQSVAQSLLMLRQTTAELRVGDQTLPAETAIVPSLESAALDERITTDPERFDITRPAPRHLAFGGGPHFCMGAPLARMLLQVAFARVSARFPGLRLAVPAAEVPRSRGPFFQTFSELPVQWPQETP